jgi:hypothetical protein
MKTKAQVDKNNNVINIAVFDDESVDEGWIEYTDLNPAYIGGDYVDGYFYPPQPYPSWSLDDDFEWQPPIPKPEGDWVWNEAEGEWESVA